jgi:membrane-associated phospholipid phosphatase
MAMEIRKAMQQLIKNSGFKGFLSGFAVFLLVGIIVFLTTKHGDVVLFINRYSSEEYDALILFLTDLGLGSVIAGVMVALLFWKVRFGLTGLISLGLVAIFTNLGKKLLFAERARPFNYFYYDDFHRFIYTAELNYHYSFPSGHSMTIFAAMSLFAVLAGKQWAGLVFFVAALVIGFTRIYLLQHFFLDVYVGSILGVVSTILALVLLNGILRLDRFSWFEKPVYAIRFKS